MAKPKFVPSPQKPSLKQKTKSSVDTFFYFLLISLFGILVIFSGISKITGSSDFFWHLATGKWIIEHRIIPDKDVFGFISEHQQWIPFEWGWDVLIYILFSEIGRAHV